jgi:hypothetical protein
MLDCSSTLVQMKQPNSGLLARSPTKLNGYTPRMRSSREAWDQGQDSGTRTVTKTLIEARFAQHNAIQCPAMLCYR